MMGRDTPLLNIDERGVVVEKRNESCAEVVKLTTEIENIKNEQDVQNRRLTAHGKELDDLNHRFNDMKTDIALLKQTNETILDNTRDIKSSIKDYRTDINTLSEFTRNEIEKLSEFTRSEIEKTNEYTRIEAEAIRKLRDEDHLHDPKKKLEKYKDHIGMLVIGAFMMYMLYQIAPFLK